ncbi:PREDICTED: F-box/WD repeat-containing protein 10-like, partial [Leptosomus discolor]|uniref:F-box/WD repeat-containing protein 10-like n=1 Tax=Leptosomus discolor TaxID=188344 RepID=UPI00052262EA
WNLESGRCLRTLKHNSAVWVVKMDGTHVVSGCDRGLVKVWCADRGTLVKTIEGHQGPVKCLSFDQWHLVTGSTDRYVLGWSMLGNLKRCLIAFRHPKEVLSLEFLYLRVISGCADGKIRIFNYLTGSCLKVLMANSRGDPISSFYVAGNRMVINSPTRLLMFQFEDIRWDYTLGADREMLKNSLHGPTVNSSIPAPSIVRPKTSCRLLREKKAHSGHNKVIPLPEDGVHLIDPFPAVSELIKSTRVMIAQMETKVISRRKKPFCPYAVDPAQSDSGFRLLTGKQKEAYEAAAVAQCQAQQAKLAEDQQRACRKAWLRKMKGLPTDSSAEEGKTAAPELGLNTFI